MRMALTVTALGAAVGLLAGCGGDGDEKDGAQAPSPTTTAQATQPPAQQAKGLDGTWKPINKSPIATLTITGTTVQTTGELACPGTITGADAAEPALTLNCARPDDQRTRGTLELKPDGTALIINWKGQAWGGMIDSLKRAG
jgi:hypothetical protein